MLVIVATFPSTVAQLPHLDYPYWDLFDESRWPNSPKHPSQPFFLSLQESHKFLPFPVMCPVCIRRRTQNVCIMQTSCLSFFVVFVFLARVSQESWERQK